MGYYTDPIDGLAGPNTMSAIESFRSQHPTEAEGTSQGVLEAARHHGRDLPARASLSGRPATGTVMHSPSRDAVAPLRVQVAPGSDFFIKLVDASSHQTAISFYIRSGEAWETKVPTGRFEIRYAVGQGWHGARCLFGEGTIAAKADQILSFKQTGRYVEGHSVQLIVQRGGNLGRIELPVSSF